MGLAASQARFLTLTARLSSNEYQGQQINQQRTALADQSANLFNKMLTFSVPTPPDSTDYSSSTTYTYQDSTGATKTITGYTPVTASDSSVSYTLTYSDGTTAKASAITTASGVLSTVTLSGASETTSLTANTKTANQAYEEAYSQYEYKKNLYDQEIANINAQTSVIQTKDRNLEMQLRQLDTAEKAYQAEIESVKKVIEKNIDIVFKTFA